MTSKIDSIVGARVAELQFGYLRDHSEAVAALARLRRGAGKPTGSVLDILSHTHDPAFVHDGDSDEPSFAENAAHTALTLYAVHQQSQRQGMHARGQRFGSAVRTVALGRRKTKKDDDTEDAQPKQPPAIRPDSPVARRFAALGTADSFTELSHHLRGLVQLMRSNDVKIDYGLLARDLWLWQLPGRADGVRLRWGRDFHFPSKDTTPGKGAEPKKDTEQ